MSSQEKRDRSAAMVPGGATSSPSAGGAQPNTNAGGGLADALAQALSARNKKVSASGKLSAFYPSTMHGTNIYWCR